MMKGKRYPFSPAHLLQGIAKAGDLSMTEKAVLWAMAAYTDWSTGETYASLTTLAKSSGAHRRTVIRTIKELRNRGVIVARPKPYVNDKPVSSNCYRLAFLTPDPRANIQPPKDGDEELEDPAQVVSESHQGGVRESLGWCQRVSSTSDTKSPNQNSYQSNKKIRDRTPCMSKNDAPVPDNFLESTELQRCAEEEAEGRRQRAAAEEAELDQAAIAYFAKMQWLTEILDEQQVIETAEQTARRDDKQGQMVKRALLLRQAQNGRPC